MTGIEDKGDPRAPQPHFRPSEAEISQLIQETAQQYEESMRVADLADISEMTETSRPRYAWDNPIGLVVTR